MEFREARSALTRDMSERLSAADEATFLRGQSRFALAIHKDLAGAKGNLAASPFSMSMAIAMAYAGARGTTESEMAAALGFELGSPRTHVGMNALERAISSRGGDGKAIGGGPLTVGIHNAIFAEQSYAFLPPFLDTLAVHYGAGVKLADFVAGAEGERVRINAWVAERTSRRIEDLLAPGILSSDTRAVLVNAIYLNAAWLSPFDPDATSDGSFSNEDGTRATVKMMVQDFTAPRATVGDVEVVTLPYSGGKLSMVAILPRSGDLAAFERALDVEGLDALLAARAPAPVHLVMPRFRIAGDAISLEAALGRLGMKAAFDPSTADFSGMSGARDLHVTDVVHKAFLDVGEQGTEAAAATGVVMGKTSVPVGELRLDRPFFVVLRDEPTGAILFTARVAQL